MGEISGKETNASYSADGEGLIPRSTVLGRKVCWDTKT